MRKKYLQHPSVVSSLKKKQAAVLAVSLIILFVMTLIGVTILRIGTLNERITANFYDSTLAMQNADTALREAENFIEGLSNLNVFTNTNGLYLQNQAPNPLSPGTWTAGNSQIAKNGNARYFIEYTGFYGNMANDINIYNYGQNPAGGGTDVFRIVSRGTGPSGTAVIILESFYGKQQ